VQLSSVSGAHVTAVCSAANAPVVTSLGASTVIDSKTGPVTERGERFVVILDAVGKAKSGEALRHAADILAPGGVIRSIDDGTPHLTREDLERVVHAVAGGRFASVVDRVYGLDDIVDAHRYVDAGHKRGNVVVTVPR
jgi:NADPH:quinone reductase-like Zn-dependent oxidoreductase